MSGEPGVAVVQAGSTSLQTQLELAAVEKQRLLRDGGVEIKTSRIHGAGQGLFAKRDLPEGYEIFYFGMYYPSADDVEVAAVREPVGHQEHEPRRRVLAHPRHPRTRVLVAQARAAPRPRRRGVDHHLEVERVERATCASTRRRRWYDSVQQVSTEPRVLDSPLP